MACGAAAGRAAGQTASSRASVRCWHPQSISKAFILPLRSRYRCSYSRALPAHHVGLSCALARPAHTHMRVHRRPNAAETLGPMVDHVEDVTRLNLAQSFEVRMLP